MPNPLSDAFDAAAGPPVDVCLTCLGPRRDAVEILVIAAPAVVPRCAACNGPLDDRGRSAVLLTERGVRQPVVIELQATPAQKAF